MREQNQKFTPAEVAGRLALVAVNLLDRAQRGERGQTERLVAKAIYSLAAACIQLPQATAAQWGHALYGRLALNAGDPQPLDFKRMAEKLRGGERTSFNAAFVGPHSPQSLTKLLRTGGAMVASSRADGDLVERAFGLALLVIAEDTLFGGAPDGDEKAVRELMATREHAFDDAAGDAGLWEQVEAARTCFERAAGRLSTFVPPAGDGGQGRQMGAWR